MLVFSANAHDAHTTCRNQLIKLLDIVHTHLFVSPTPQPLTNHDFRESDLLEPLIGRLGGYREFKKTTTQKRNDKTEKKANKKEIRSGWGDYHCLKNIIRNKRHEVVIMQ